jgi:hypothetical protein
MGCASWFHGRGEPHRRNLQSFSYLGFFMGSCSDLLNYFNWVREQSYRASGTSRITGVTQLSFSAASIAGSQDGPSGCYGVAPVWLENLATPG